ncbi:MAG: polysaccharide biosynthesis C-terminal domain-containing protein, partial [Acidobacteriota bacterium]|nr:polysaccharide biosynthesis C-terminal domain-containing protein [Acidobacteriota bacterium]
DCAVFLVLCVLWSRPFGLTGIGLAATAAAAVNVSILLTMLRRREGKLGGRSIATSLARVVVAALVMGAALAFALKWIPAERWRGALGALALTATIAAAAIVYWLTAAILGAREPSELRAVAGRRRGKEA